MWGGKSIRSVDLPGKVKFAADAAERFGLHESEVYRRGSTDLVDHPRKMKVATDAAKRFGLNESAGLFGPPSDGP